MMVIIVLHTITGVTIHVHLTDRCRRRDLNFRGTSRKCLPISLISATSRTALAPTLPTPAPRLPLWNLKKRKRNSDKFYYIIFEEMFRSIPMSNKLCFDKEVKRAWKIHESKLRDLKSSVSR